MLHVSRSSGVDDVSVLFGSLSLSRTKLRSRTLGRVQVRITKPPVSILFPGWESYKKKSMSQ